jgi:hypothetical protein
MDEQEFEAIREAARRRGVTVSEWARSVMREARRADSGGDADRKLAAIRVADRRSYPTADIDQMLAEVQQGYGEADDS